MRVWCLSGNSVFPACAGMFPKRLPQNCSLMSFPRVRGDVPSVKLDAWSTYGFSPRARGCSCREGGGDDAGVVFPACAGMFLIWLRARGVWPGFPRVRGDVPP